VTGAPTQPSLEAFRLADSFLPEGSDTLSYGLEQFVEQGDVTDAEECRALVETYLREVIGPADLIALRHAHAATRVGDLERIAVADRRLDCVTLAREFRESSTRSGDRLLALHGDLLDGDELMEYARRVDRDDAPGHYAVVLGVVTAVTDVEETVACRIACHGFATGMLAAAQRLASIGHTDIQSVLRDLQPAIQKAVTASADRSLEQMAPFAPSIDVATATHERADRRLFLS
jgi:urease accessory protein